MKEYLQWYRNLFVCVVNLLLKSEKNPLTRVENDLRKPELLPFIALEYIVYMLHMITNYAQTMTFFEKTPIEQTYCEKFNMCLCADTYTFRRKNVT